LLLNIDQEPRFDSVRIGRNATEGQAGGRAFLEYGFAFEIANDVWCVATDDYSPVGN
jgi:hypothetical protein